MRGTLAALAAVAAKEERRLFIVGGFVRDALMGIQSRDVDMVVNDEAEQFAKHVSWRLRGGYELLNSKLQFSRVTVCADDGLPLTLDFSLQRGRHIADDLCFRDFTVNAMAISLEDYLKGDGWEDYVSDPCGGKADLAAGLLRLTSEECLRDDPVRLLRSARFLHKVGLRLDGETAEMIRRNAPLIRQSAKMKLAIEFFQLLSAPQAADGIRVLHYDLNVLSSFFPPLGTMACVSEGGEDLLTHGLRTCDCLDEFLSTTSCFPGRLVEQLHSHLKTEVTDRRRRLAYLRLACLIHDIGKLDASAACTAHLFSHEQAGEAYVGSLARLLKLSEGESALLTALVCAHSRVLYIEEGPAGLAGKLRFFRQFGDYVPELILLGIANLSAQGRCSDERVAILISILDEYFSGAGQELPAPIISAREVMEFFNLPPSRAVGGLLEQSYAAQLSGTVKTHGQALALISTLIDRWER
jgi:tRNA nucleotidyltransferase/poly(A) polymerase